MTDDLASPTFRITFHWGDMPEGTAGVRVNGRYYPRWKPRMNLGEYRRRQRGRAKRRRR